MIRSVILEDAKAITDIYNYYVETHIATLEETKVDSSFFENEILTITPNFPWYVYEENNQIIGYAYASKWKMRSGYRKSVQLTVYLKHNTTSKGIGSLLYEKVINKLKEMHVHVIMGGISLPNPPSVRLHERFGFEKVAHYKEIGYKFNKWVDVGYWQLILNK